MEAGNKCCRFNSKSLSISSFQLKCWKGRDTAPSQDVLCKPIHTNSPVAEAQEHQSEKKVTFTSLYICMSSMIFICQRGLSVSWVQSAFCDISFFLLLTSSEPCPMENSEFFTSLNFCRSFDLFQLIFMNWRSLWIINGNSFTVNSTLYSRIHPWISHWITWIFQWR